MTNCTCGHPREEHAYQGCIFWKEGTRRDQMIGCPCTQYVEAESKTGDFSEYLLDSLSADKELLREYLKAQADELRDQVIDELVRRVDQKISFEDAYFAELVRATAEEMKNGK